MHLFLENLAILYPGEGGVSLATKEAMGKKYQLLTSFYLICAVFFGPVAVLIIAAKFIQNLFPDISIELLAFFIYIITYLFLRSKVNFIGKMMLIVSSTITILFLLSSIVVLSSVENYTFSFPTLSFNEFGYALLVVFWSIVGWEVIGNYSKEVEDTKTLTKSIVFSATIISIVYIFLTLAITLGEFPKDEEFKLVWLIEPLFGKICKFYLSCYFSYTLYWYFNFICWSSIKISGFTKANFLHLSSLKQQCSSRSFKCIVIIIHYHLVFSLFGLYNFR
ncbi:MAG: amino acid permease [Halarcobacter ebronensis]